MRLRWLWRGAAGAVLLAWAAGLVFAALELHVWERELVQTMLQLRADRTFRVRMAQRREPVPREWYRAKALALLAAGGRLQDDDRWARFVPGSWQPVDSLRERVAQRLEREFSEIALETIRRELDFRASQLAGVPRDPLSGELQPARTCAEPAPVNSFQVVGVSGQGVPELEAVQSHLAQIEAFEHAVQALRALQSASGGGAQALRELVHYTLGADMTGDLSRSAALLRQVLQPTDPAQERARAARWQQALRCSLAKRMAALDARVFDRSDLLAGEAMLASRLRELSRPTDRPVAESVAQWRDAVARLTAQEQLLGTGANGWLLGRSQDLGPLHEALLARMARVQLLGDDAVQALRRHSAAALQRLQRGVRALTAGPHPALVWREEQQRLAAAPERIALREQLTALLQEPFMTAVPARGWPPGDAGALAWDTQRLADALELGQLRRRFATERLPRFPPGMRLAVARVVDRQLAQQVEDAAADAMRPAGVAIPAGAQLAAWRAQRQQAVRVQALLAQLGAGGSAERLRVLLAGDVAARLALADDALAQSPLTGPQLEDFGWWSGEPAPLLRAFGVLDAAALRQAIAQQVGGLHQLRAQVAPLLQEARATSADRLAARWQAIAAELDRARAGRADGSLGAFRQALLSLGPDLTLATCASRVAAAPAPRASDDVFARRHRALLEALARRCGELRTALPAPPLAPVPATGYLPG